MLTHTHTYVKYLKARYSKINQVGSLNKLVKIWFLRMLEWV